MFAITALYGTVGFGVNPVFPKTVFGTDGTIGEAMGCGSRITGRANSKYAVAW